MENMKPLNKGVAYHGNRMLTHIREDMEEIMRAGFNTVLHMFTHNDWNRHKEIMKEIFEITRSYGLDVWVDNWGLGGPPGDVSHFLSIHPEAHQYYSNGEMDPIRACYNAPSFRQFTKDWIDVVREAGGEKIFWDEPHLVGQDFVDGIPGKWTCRCPECQKLFEERYHKPMPVECTPEVAEFRAWTVTNYFEMAANYAKSLGMYNTACMMLGGYYGVDVAEMCSVPALDCVGSDPYWWEGQVGYQAVYQYVYEKTKINLDICEKYQKDHNLWIKTYRNERGREEEIIAAADAMYDAGARNIFAWSFRGADANDYRAECPGRVWEITKEAMRRISDRERDAQLKLARANIGYRT